MKIWLVAPGDAPAPGYHPPFYAFSSNERAEEFVRSQGDDYDCDIFEIELDVGKD